MPGPPPARRARARRASNCRPRSSTGATASCGTCPTSRDPFQPWRKPWHEVPIDAEIARSLLSCALQASQWRRTIPTGRSASWCRFRPAARPTSSGAWSPSGWARDYKQSVVVENRPGASGHLGAQQVAKAPGDGYTLLAGTIGIHAAYASYRKLGYDPAAELQPILVLGESPNIVTVPAASPYKTFGDFLADAKANPGKINYASAGPGSSIHMVTALFELQSGDAPDARPLQGQRSGADRPHRRADPGDVREFLLRHAAGARRQAARAGRHQRQARSEARPTCRPSPRRACPATARHSWFTLAAPRSMPRGTRREAESRCAARAVRRPRSAARLDALGVTFTPNTPAEAAAFFKSETAKWNRVIEAANLRLD